MAFNLFLIGEKVCASGVVVVVNRNYQKQPIKCPPYQIDEMTSLAAAAISSSLDNRKGGKRISL